MPMLNFAFREKGVLPENPSGETSALGTQPAGIPAAVVAGGFGSSISLPWGFQQTPPTGTFQVHPHYRTPRNLDAVLRKVQAGFDDFVAEKYHDQVAAILARWSDQLLKSPAQTAEIESVLASTLNATPPIPVDSQNVRASSFLNVSRNRFAPEKHFDRAAWIRDWRSALSGFSSLDRKST